MTIRPERTDGVGRYRWFICSLLFAATTINYLDRTVLAVLGPTLQYKVFHWTDRDFAAINATFNAAYALGMISMGAMADRFGTKIGYAVSIAIWSVCGMLHAAVRPAFSVLGFAAARFGLAFGEAGNYPCAVKTISEWFPRAERPLASGFFNAGSNVGAILAPVVVPLIVAADGSRWQLAFLITGAFSALWVIVWLRVYHRPAVGRRLSRNEWAYIQGGLPVAPVVNQLPWRRILAVRETWAFAAAKVTDAAWWFYMFWGAKFLYDRFGLNLKSVALPLIAIYVMSDLGGIGGGWWSSFQMSRGRTANRAIKTTLCLAAACTLPVMLVTQINTRFTVDDRFFQRLALETVPAGGERTGSASAAAGFFTGEDSTALRGLSGREFSSAQAFLAAVRGVLSRGDRYQGEVPFAQIEGVLVSSARSDNFYWLAVALIGLAAVGHTAWSANIFAMVMNVFPPAAVASVTGVGGTVGAAASMIANLTLGQLLTASGPRGYMAAFFFTGSIYLAMLGLLQLLTPRMAPLDGNLQHVA